MERIIANPKGLGRPNSAVWAIIFFLILFWAAVAAAIVELI
ncbi:MAG: hypothetical protein V4559_00800 [Pseudomonadota bacterium]